MEDRNAIYLMRGGTPAEVLDLGMECLSDRCAVVMDNVEKQGVLYLPPSGRMNADLGTVSASGIKELPVGTRVAVLPGHGLYMEKEGREVRVLGISDDWHQSIPFWLSGTPERPIVHPTNTWCAIKREKKESIFEVPDIEQWRQWLEGGTVLAVGQDFGVPRTRSGRRIPGDFDAGVKVGDTVYFHADPNKPNIEELIVIKFGGMDDIVLVRYPLLQVVVEAA